MLSPRSIWRSWRRRGTESQPRTTSPTNGSVSETECRPPSSTVIRPDSSMSATTAGLKTAVRASSGIRRAQARASMMVWTSAGSRSRRARTRSSSWRLPLVSAWDDTVQTPLTGRRPPVSRSSETLRRRICGLPRERAWSWSPTVRGTSPPSSSLRASSVASGEIAVSGMSRRRSSVSIQWKSGGRSLVRSAMMTSFAVPVIMMLMSVAVLSSSRLFAVSSARTAGLPAASAARICRIPRIVEPGSVWASGGSRASRRASAP